MMNVKGFRVRERAAKERRERRLVSPEVRAERARMLQEQQEKAASNAAVTFETPKQKAQREAAERAAADAAKKAEADEAERKASLAQDEKAAQKKGKKAEAKE